MDKYKQKWVNWVVWLNLDKKALTIGQTTYYSCDKHLVSPQLKKHEDAHKLQWKHFGWSFPFRYLYELFRYGYKFNRFEVEARKAEFK